MTRTALPASPADVQVSPPSELFRIPRRVPAYRLAGEAVSRARTSAPSMPPSAFQLEPPLLLLKTALPSDITYNVEPSRSTATVLAAAVPGVSPLLASVHRAPNEAGVCITKKTEARMKICRHLIALELS